LIRIKHIVIVNAGNATTRKKNAAIGYHAEPESGTPEAAR